MEIITLDKTNSAASLTGFASNVTGATWTLTTTTTDDTLSHKVTIKNDSATDHSAKTADLVGTANGAAVTETLALPAGSATVTSVNYYETLTSVTPSATIGADTMDIGWAAASQSDWQAIPRSRPDSGSNIGFGCTVVSGSPNYTVQHTFDGTAAFDHSTVAAKTVSAEGAYTFPIAGVRFRFTVAGRVKMTILMDGR